MVDRRKDRFALLPVLAIIIVGLFVLYVMSSGPSRLLAYRHWVLPPPPGSDLPVHMYQNEGWWLKLYAPLESAAEQSWGKPIYWYWSFFPQLEIRSP